MSRRKSGFYIGTFHNDNYKYVSHLITITDEPEIFELDKNHFNMTWRIGDTRGWEFDDFKNVSLVGFYHLETLNMAPIFGQKLVIGQYYWGYFQDQGWEPVLCVLNGGQEHFRRLGKDGIYSCAMYGEQPIFSHTIQYLSEHIPIKIYS